MLRFWVRELDELFGALGRSGFRRKFALSGKDRDYLRTKGLEVVMGHGEKFVRKRLAPAKPTNDGKQTPWRGHPVFVAQHGTGTCCRTCLAKWHGIPAGAEMTEGEIHYVLSVLKRWLEGQV